MQTWKPSTERPIIACVDVDYRESGASAAALWFRGWEAETPEHRERVLIPKVAEYEPGAFYKRELPCLLGVLANGPTPEIIVIDGYVWLGEGVPGLGAHLFEHLERKVAVVGVAKTKFASATAVPVLRGESKNPLYVTAAGMDVEEAAQGVRAMHGEFRLPTLLKMVDQLARKIDSSDG